MKITTELQDQYKQLISKDFTTKQIADELKMSWSTVKGHFRKLGLRTIYKKDPVIIDEHKLREMVNQNCSVDKIAKEFKCSHAPIKTALQTHGLKTEAKWTIARKTASDEIKSGFKTCPKCKIKKELVDNYYIRKDGNIHAWCKQCNNQITYQKQKQMKVDAVAYKGGKCQLCNYNKYVGALDFHHLDPSKKDFAISELKSYSWEIIQSELDKCICVCKNCHAEIHGKITDVIIH